MQPAALVCTQGQLRVFVTAVLTEMSAQRIKLHPIVEVNSLERCCLQWKNPHLPSSAADLHL